MAYGFEVLEMLLPEGGWTIVGDDYQGITFLSCQPITEKKFTEGFAQFDAWKAQVAADNAAAKSALLARLGITAEEAKLLFT